MILALRAAVQKRILFPLLVTLISTFLALALGEGLLRVYYPSLPSLAPLTRSPYSFEPFEWSDWPHNNDFQDQRTTCSQDGFLLPPSLDEGAPGEGDGKEFWVVGDSMSVGVGLPPGSAYASQLRKDLSAQWEEEVHLRNLASPGADFCTILHILDENLSKRPQPDAVIVQFYADDLHGRARVAIGDELVMFPDWVRQPALRYLVKRSYIANLMWYRITPAREALPPRFIDPAGQTLFVESVKALKAKADERGLPVIVVLLAPTGLHLCPDPPPTDSRCMWMGADMDLIADMLGRAEVDFVDLRRFWEGKPTMVVPLELERIEKGEITMGIHPDEAGHRALADALKPYLTDALSTDDSP